MSEPVIPARDFEMASKACRNRACDGAFIWGAVAKQIAIARSEERAACRKRAYDAMHHGTFNQRVLDAIDRADE